MNPNIYEFAYTEYAQDAFISWLCSCYNQNVNSAKKKIAKRFIKELLGVNIDFSSVSIKNQYLDIDILITLTSENGKYFVIVEDKKFSKYHGEQLKNYINKLIDKEKAPADRIFAVYYKTGHISKTPNTIYSEKNILYYDPTILSEYDSVKVVEDDNKPLTICDLQKIKEFFWKEDIQDLIKRSGSEILEDYSNNILKLYNSIYSADVLPARKEHDEQNDIWGRVFDEFISENKGTFKNLFFKLDFYSGKYWEICITKKIDSTEKLKFPDQPILDIRAKIFKTPRIYFFLVPPDSILLAGQSDVVKVNPSSCSYYIKWDELKGFEASDFSRDTIKIDKFKEFLKAVCEKFSRCIEDTKIPFNLYE